jgi:hypothetical protein
MITVMKFQSLIAAIMHAVRLPTRAALLGCLPGLGLSVALNGIRA